VTGIQPGSRFRRTGALLAVGVLAATVSACSGSDGNSAGGGGSGDGYQVKLGYFPNLTLVIVVWQILFMSGWKPESVFPGPVAVFERLWNGGTATPSPAPPSGSRSG
jgi:hypothetical protein